MTADPTDSCSACRFWLWAGVALVLLGALGAAIRFLPDRPVRYDDPVEHFKYGSTGGERNMGFPYWLFQVLPEVCPDFLPGKGYESLGFIFEPGRDLPVGMSKRRHLGHDPVFLNCAVCHTATVRTAPGARPADAANTSFGNSHTTNREVVGSKAGALVTYCWSCQTFPKLA